MKKSKHSHTIVIGFYNFLEAFIDMLASQLPVEPSEIPITDANTTYTHESGVVMVQFVRPHVFGACMGKL